MKFNAKINCNYKVPANSIVFFKKIFIDGDIFYDTSKFSKCITMNL